MNNNNNLHKNHIRNLYHAINIQRLMRGRDTENWRKTGAYIVKCNEK
jgi:hypothetical protein